MASPHLLEERLTHSVIGACYQVCNALGFGFMEHVYTMALERELFGLEPAFYRLVRTRPKLTGPAPTFRR